MSKKQSDIILATAAVCIVAGVGYWIWQRNVADVPSGLGPEAISGAEKRYESREYGLAFSYPEHYLLTEEDVSSSHHAIALIEDTAENRDVLGGKSPGRDGPIAITIGIRDNPSRQSAEDWARSSSASNLLMGNGLTASTTVDGADGIAYRWSGLYEGESVVVAANKKIYMFTATYLSPADQTIRDFSTILATVRL